MPKCPTHTKTSAEKRKEKRDAERKLKKTIEKLYEKSAIDRQLGVRVSKSKLRKLNLLRTHESPLDAAERTVSIKDHVGNSIHSMDWNKNGFLNKLEEFGIRKSGDIQVSTAETETPIRGAKRPIWSALAKEFLPEEKRSLGNAGQIIKKFAEDRGYQVNQDCSRKRTIRPKKLRMSCDTTVPSELSRKKMDELIAEAIDKLGLDIGEEIVPRQVILY